jgi:hypothetical protein
MKEKTKPQSGSFTKPLLDSLVQHDKANYQANFHPPTVGSTPLAQPALYQDPGSGYNADFDFPQD